jgi:hypothetical protein
VPRAQAPAGAHHHDEHRHQPDSQKKHTPGAAHTHH